jgi:CheY-like chemotaxis protein
MYTVLIIDANPTTLRVTQAPLERLAGWQTLLANSEREGFTLVQQAQPDAILLNLVMPAMDCLTTLRHLRAHPVTQAMPVILLTASPPTVWPQMVAGLPITGIIHTPFKAPAFVQQMRSLLHWYA